MGLIIVQLSGANILKKNEKQLILSDDCLYTYLLWWGKSGKNLVYVEK